MKKLRTNYIGFPVEVSLEPPTGCNAPDNSIPSSVMDLFCEEIEAGKYSGTFSDMPDDEMRFGSGQGYTRSGSWRVIELDFEKISRILAWERHCAQDEQLSPELFIRYYGQVLGQHYYEKWLHINRNLHDMLAYFDFNAPEGQILCDMIMEQMHKFEARKRGEIGLKSTNNTPEQMQA